MKFISSIQSFSGIITNSSSELFCTISGNEDVIKFIRDILPGEIVVINQDGIKSINTHCKHKPHICVFEYIDGKNYFELNQKASKEIIKDLAIQTAMINQLDIKPDFIYDSWAIINFEEEYKNKREYISDEYKEEFDKLLSEFKKLDFDKLQKVFVH